MKPAKITKAFLVLALIASTALIAVPAKAQSTPSVPQFSVQYVNSSYTIPPVYTTNPYTGQVTEEVPSRTIDNSSLLLTIQNQPFTPYFDGNQTISLYYNIRCKGHYEQYTSDTDVGSHGQSGLQSSSGPTTVVSFDVQDWGVPIGGEIDFAVQAFIGYSYFNAGECGTDNVVTVGESAWSNTETIVLGYNTVTVSTTPDSGPAPTATPSPNGFSNSTNEYTNPYVTVPLPSVTSAPKSIGQNAQQGTPLLGSGVNWTDIILIVMAAVIAVLFGSLVAVMKYRRQLAK
jgi:hypothetical protein